MNYGDPVALAVTLAMIIAALTAYIFGWVHGWSRHDLERRFAYCEGYDRASSSMLAMTSADRGDVGGGC
jgi:hydrogenase/urease accessory protein HupE